MPSLKEFQSGDALANNLAALSLHPSQLLRTAARTARDRAAAAYVTTHEPTKAMLRVANMVAADKQSVLILGPTGTGKELIARILHAPREAAQAPLIPINCAGITDTLFESQLFGHKKGSFTDAVSDSSGLLVAADEGTVFFDEIGELPLNQQAKILRTLQSGYVTPVGTADERPIKCRFVFATNRDIKSMVDNSMFRADLYYRISTCVLRTFPLAERPDDIVPIARAIFARNDWDWDPIIGADIPAAAYTPGNVRQLENFLYRRNKLAMSTEAALIDL